MIIRNRDAFLSKPRTSCRGIHNQKEKSHDEGSTIWSKSKREHTTSPSSFSLRSNSTIDLEIQPCSAANFFHAPPPNSPGRRKPTRDDLVAVPIGQTDATTQRRTKVKEQERSKDGPLPNRRQQKHDRPPRRSEEENNTFLHSLARPIEGSSARVLLSRSTSTSRLKLRSTRKGEKKKTCLALYGCLHSFPTPSDCLLHFTPCTINIFIFLQKKNTPLYQ